VHFTAKQEEREKAHLARGAGRSPEPTAEKPYLSRHFQEAARAFVEKRKRGPFKGR